MLRVDVRRCLFVDCVLVGVCGTAPPVGVVGGCLLCGVWLLVVVWCVLVGCVCGCWFAVVVDGVVVVVAVDDVGVVVVCCCGVCVGVCVW